MRKGRRERIEKGSSERIEKERKGKKENRQKGVEKIIRRGGGPKRNKETIPHGPVTQGSHSTFHDEVIHIIFASHKYNFMIDIYQLPLLGFCK